MVTLHELADLGVSVMDYSTGRAVDLDSSEGRITTTLKTEFAQQFRDQIRKHTRAAMWEKAKKGWITGGKVFGYDNRRVAAGHCEYRVNPTEAAVVHEIYARFAAGEGARSIAMALNAANVPKPRAQQGRKDGWSVSTIRCVLERPLYRGEVVYGRAPRLWGRELKKVRPGTQRESGQVEAPDETWVRVENRALAIIDPDLALRVDQRRLDRRERYLASVRDYNGRMPERSHGKYLLTGGMLICPSCGGHFEARIKPWKGQRDVYICATRRRKPGICHSTLALPIAETDAALLSVIEGEVLDPKFVDRLLAMLDPTGDDVAAMGREREQLVLEMKRLAESIAAGVPAETIAPAMRERQSALRVLDTRLRAPRVAPKRDQVRAALEQRLADWQTALRSEVEIARVVLRELVGPLTLWDDTPTPDFVRWEAERKAENMLATVAVCPSVLVTSPRGVGPLSVNDVNGAVRLAA